MNIQTHTVRSGFDGKRCLVHARCCQTPDKLIATAQYLDINGCDLFSGILMSTSTDGGAGWTEFVPQEGLAPVTEGDTVLVGCDATPMYHQKTGKVILLGHTAQYAPGAYGPTGKCRSTFYSVYDPEANTFGKMRFLSVPQAFGGKYGCGNGCGQSVELDNGDLLIPVYFKNETGLYTSCVMRCGFDGRDLTLLETGSLLTLPVIRGLFEPSLVFHRGEYFMTLRNNECGAVAKSADGLHFSELHLWQWQDGSLVDTYNTQQHWLTLGNELYLVYTRRGADNDRVFRHRAPLFMAKVENMRLLRETERAIVPERGARLGNFGVTRVSDREALVMAAEWMQPKGCEAYGSDNSVFLSRISL